MKSAKYDETIRQRGGTSDRRLGTLRLSSTHGRRCLNAFQSPLHGVGVSDLPGMDAGRVLLLLSDHVGSTSSFGPTVTGGTL